MKRKTTFMVTTYTRDGSREDSYNGCTDLVADDRVLTFKWGEDRDKKVMTTLDFTAIEETT